MKPWPSDAYALCCVWTPASVSALANLNPCTQEPSVVSRGHPPVVHVGWAGQRTAELACFASRPTLTREKVVRSWSSEWGLGCGHSSRLETAGDVPLPHRNRCQNHAGTDAFYYRPHSVKLRCTRYR
jgi:hypothetical protein